MTIMLPTRMTVDEFLVWSQRQDKGRYELQDGRVILQQSQNVAHLEVKAHVFDALREAIARSGLPLYALPDGATVRITSAMRRGIVQFGRSATGHSSSGVTTRLAASLFTGGVPGARLACTASMPPRMKSARQKRTMSSRTPNRRFARHGPPLRIDGRDRLTFAIRWSSSWRRSTSRGKHSAQ